MSTCPCGSTNVVQHFTGYVRRAGAWVRSLAWRCVPCANESELEREIQRRS